MSTLPAILVTGGAGFIGSCFVSQAVAKNYRVLVLDALTYAGNRENLAWITPKDSWQFIQGNINDRALVARLLSEYTIGYVVNFAAETHVDNSIAAPATFLDTNVTGVFNLLETCRDYWQSKRRDFRFLHISTDEVYGSLDVEDLASETSPLHPSSPYAASKAAGDHLASAWFTTYGFPAIITRSSNNYGPRQHREKFIPTIIKAALAGTPIPVYGDGKQVRDWMHVADHCDGIWLALEKGRAGEIYNLGANNELDNISLVQLICDQLSIAKPNIAYVADRPGHDRRYALDSSKAKRELGFAPHRHFAKELKTTIDWYKSAWR